MTTHFNSSVGCVTAIALNLLNVLQTDPLVGSVLHDLLIAVISHITKNLNLGVIKSSQPVLAAAVGVNPVNRLRCHFKT